MKLLIVYSRFIFVIPVKFKSFPRGVNRVTIIS